LERAAYPILKVKVETYSQILWVNIPEILIKSNLKSTWASLTKRGLINFNMHLIKAPHDVIDYIVLHELCHLKIKGHPHHYWNLAGSVEKDPSLNWLCKDCPYLTDCKRIQQAAAVAA